jgi:hypothetical protein
VVCDVRHMKCSFFENDPEKCFNNIQYRNDGRNISLQGLKSFNYTIPENTETLPIWQPNEKYT